MKIHKVKQGTLPWFALRIGKVTGSRFAKMMSNDNLSLVDILVAERVTGQSEDTDYVSEEMQRGTDLEPLARVAYETHTKKKVRQIGFITSTQYPMFGLSPDGFVGRKGAIEIKCMSTRNHVKAIRQNKVLNEYKYQVICYFLINEKLEWLDFVSYDPRFWKRPLHIHRVTRTDLLDDIAEAEQVLKAFFEKFQRIESSIIF